MCFSAGASFAASGGLIILGGTSIAVGKKRDKILAAVPFIFGIQQFFEGIQWLRLDAGSTSTFAGYAFLFFALMVWPVFVPTFIYILDLTRRPILQWFVLLGSLVAIYFLIILLTQPMHISEVGYCVQYKFNFPFEYYTISAYALAIFGPLFLSSRKVFRRFGFIVAISAIISWYFYFKTFTSVWCFFAAILSSLLLIYTNRRRKKSDKINL